MEKNNNQIIDFVLPGDITLAEVIDDILKKNGLKESLEEYYDESNKDKEPRVVIIRNAALVILQKKIPEEKLVELLQKHLETSQETAQKTVNDINQKLIPFAKIINLEKESKIEDQKEEFREKLIEKINANRNIATEDEEKYPLPYSKKLDITNVEENAKIIQKEKKFTEENKNKTIEETKKFGDNKFANEKKDQDTYREPIG